VGFEGLGMGVSGSRVQGSAFNKVFIGFMVRISRNLGLASPVDDPVDAGHPKAVVFAALFFRKVHLRATQRAFSRRESHGNRGGGK
jgi:hypothetical protein